MVLPRARSADFGGGFRMQGEAMQRLNLLWGHAPIAIAYKTWEMCSAMGTTFLPTSTSPRKSLEFTKSAKSSKNGFSASCAMRSQNDNMLDGCVGDHRQADWLDPSASLVPVCRDGDAGTPNKSC